MATDSTGANGKVVDSDGKVLMETEENENSSAKRDDKDEELPAAPDGGWGWMVVFGSFMIHVIADGAAYSFGVYVDDFIDYFECSRSEVGWLGSLMIGVTWGTGPIASALVNKFGCRAVTIAGTLIASFGFIISLFAPSIYFMYFSFGIVAGLGLGMAYLPAIVAVSFYFEKRRSLATGLAVCGSGIGTFIFAPLTQALLDEYTWKGTVLIEAGILLNCILCGMVFRPIDMTGTAPAEQKKLLPEKEGVAGDKVAVEASSSATGLQAPGKITSSCTDLPKSSSSSSTESRRRRTQSESWKAHAEHSKPTSGELVKPMSRKDVFYTHSLTNIPMYNTDPEHYKKSMTSVTHIDQDEVDDSCLSKLGVTEDMRKTMREMMDLRLLCDAVFVLFAVSNFLTSVGYIVPYIFLPNRGLELGLTETQAAWLLSVVGISNTVGRIVFGFIADFKFVNRLMMYNTVLVLCGLTSILSALCFTFALQLCYAFSFGFFIGVYTALTPIVLVDLLGLYRLSNSFGLVLLFQGLGAVAGPPFAGYLYDVSKNYDNSFYMMGICILVSGAMLYPVPCLQRCQKNEESDSDVALGKTPVSHHPRALEEEVVLNEMSA